MAFPVGWLRKCAVTCDHTKVGSGGVSAFPGLLTEVDFPSEMLTTSGANAAQSDGGDIRFSSDAAGASQLACEVVLWTQNANPALAKAEVWIACALSSSADTVVYVWYSAGGGVAQPAANAAFGAQAVWDANTKAAWHLPNGATLTANDSTASALNGTLSGTAVPTAAAGKIDGGASFNGSSSYIAFSSEPLFIASATTFTVSFWSNETLTTAVKIVYDNAADSGAFTQGIGIYLDGRTNPNGLTGTKLVTCSIGRVTGGLYVAGTTTAIPNDGALHHYQVTWDGTSMTFYIDGVAKTTQVSTTFHSSGAFVTRNFALNIGRSQSANTGYLAGILDEVRVSSSARAASWIATSYNNQNSPGSFWTVGTPTAVNLIQIIGAHSYRLRRAL